MKVVSILNYTARSAGSAEIINTFDAPEGIFPYEKVRK